MMLPGSGIATCRGTVEPSPPYSVEQPVALSLIQKGLPAGVNATPHAFCKTGSNTAAPPLISETSGVTSYALRCPPSSAIAAVTPRAEAAMIAPAVRQREITLMLLMLLLIRWSVPEAVNSPCPRLLLEFPHVDRQAEFQPM